VKNGSRDGRTTIEKSSPPAAAEPSGYRSPQAGRFVWHRPPASLSGVFLALSS